jgi:hypothetical protein
MSEHSLTEPLFDEGGESNKWNHHPGEVRLNPLYSWPPDPAAVWRWYAGAWLQVTALTVPFLVAVLCYALFLPPLEAMEELRFDWIFRVWLLSLVPQMLLAGGLHWFLYIRKAQGMEKKFETRDLTRKSAIFTFDNQVLDNIWWTLGSAITVGTVYQVLVFWGMANGVVPVVTFADTPVWFCLWMAMVPMFSSLHFYWVHRLAHNPKLFKHVQRCITATSMSGRGRASRTTGTRTCCISAATLSTWWCPRIRCT